MFYNSIKLKFKLKGSLVRKTKVAPDENEKKFNSTQFNSQISLSVDNKNKIQYKQILNIQ